MRKYINILSRTQALTLVKDSFLSLIGGTSLHVYTGIFHDLLGRQAVEKGVLVCWYDDSCGPRRVSQYPPAPFCLGSIPTASATGPDYSPPTIYITYIILYFFTAKTDQAQKAHLLHRETQLTGADGARACLRVQPVVLRTGSIVTIGCRRQ